MNAGHRFVEPQYVNAPVPCCTSQEERVPLVASKVLGMALAIRQAGREPSLHPGVLAQVAAVRPRNLPVGPAGWYREGLD